VRGPGLADLGLHVSESHAGRRIRDANEMVAGRTLNLSPGKLRLTFQGLIAMGTIELEFGIAHISAQISANARQKYIEIFPYFLPTDCAWSGR